jgi:beta-mannosidase
MITMRTTSLATGWEFAEINAHGWSVGKAPATHLPQVWLSAQVPGHVHSDLMRHGIIGDPYSRMAEFGVRWVDDADWSYRTTFTWSAEEDLPHRTLRFEGLDTYATIWLNDQRIGRADNYHVAHEFDVSDVLVEGENTLRIDFQSAIRRGNQARDDYFARHNLAADTANFPERAFTRKPQYMYGWDWGPRLVSCGIWQPVHLVEYRARLGFVQIDPHLDDEGDAHIHVTVEAEGLTEGDAVVLQAPWAPLDPEVPADVDPDTVWYECARGEDGLYRATLVLPSPDLWWPVGMGEQTLYPLTIAIEDADGAPVERREEKFGVRTVELVREKDSFGESFFFRINGEPVYAVGANWIPDHNFTSTITRAQLREKLADAVAMNMNMLRVWGGGQYESKDFYELADEMGLLIWQDFPYGCSYAPDDDEHHAEIRHEATFNIKRLRNHPCLVLWCGNNENETMFDSKWGGADRNPERMHGRAIWEETLPEVLAEHDPSRPYIPSSPTGKDESLVDERNGLNANMGHIGDSHYWDVWHGRGDWEHYEDSDTRFSSEFGFASSMSRYLAEDTMGPDIVPGDAESETHNKTNKPFATIRDFAELHYPRARTFNDWIYTSQLNQRDALRHGIEHWRRSEFCRGTLIWQLNDCWPVFSWAIMDSHGHWKPAAHEVQRMYAPQMLSWQGAGADWTLIAVNDNAPRPEAVAGVILRVDLATHETEVVAEVAEGWETDRQALWQGQVETGNALLFASCISSDGHDIEVWRLLCEPKDVSGQPVAVVVSRVDDGRIQVATEGPVVDLWLHDLDGPTEFRPNCLTAPGPTVFEIQTDGEVGRVEVRSLQGLHPVSYTRSPL